MYEKQIAFLNKILGKIVGWQPALQSNCLLTIPMHQKETIEFCDSVLKYILDRTNPGEPYSFKFIRVMESSAVKPGERASIFRIDVDDVDNLMKLAPESKGTPYVEKNISELCEAIIAKISQFADDSKKGAELQKKSLRAPTPEGIRAWYKIVDYNNENLPKVIATLKTIQSGRTITAEQHAHLRKYSYICYMSSVAPMMFVKLFLHIENMHLAEVLKSEPAKEQEGEAKAAPSGDPVQTKRDETTLYTMVQVGGIAGMGGDRELKKAEKELIKLIDLKKEPEKESLSCL